MRWLPILVLLITSLEIRVAAAEFKVLLQSVLDTRWSILSRRTTAHAQFCPHYKDFKGRVLRCRLLLFWRQDGHWRNACEPGDQIHSPVVHGFQAPRFWQLRSDCHIRIGVHEASLESLILMTLKS